MMISRHIGYQEKKKKQSTAPIRNPCADALRLALRPRLAAARERARCGVVGSGSALRATATMGPPGIRSERAVRPALSVGGGGRAGRDHRPDQPLLARIWL